ncbi:MAG: MucR family transcriptional regulator [Desulfovibrio sp.]|jgi:predicted transcriptional regulator|nr:MucR family transcriptional regulator [Desulfovibrio sp.]
MEEHIKEVLEIVKAQASVRSMSEEEINAMIRSLAAGIRGIGTGGGAPEEDEPARDAKKAIKEKSISCVVCGKTFKILTKKHLALHGFNAKSYREHCGYKKGTPLVCKSLQRERRKKMKEMRLWERRAQ